MEIEMFFAKYDLDGDGIFSMDEGNQIINDLDADNIDREVRDIPVLQFKSLDKCEKAQSVPILYHF